MEAVIQACKKNDINALLKIFGTAGKDIVVSGDPSDDTDRRATFARLAHEKYKLIQDKTNPDKTDRFDRQEGLAVSGAARSERSSMVF